MRLELSRWKTWTSPRTPLLPWQTPRWTSLQRPPLRLRQALATMMAQQMLPTVTMMVMTKMVMTMMMAVTMMEAVMATWTQTMGAITTTSTAMVRTRQHPRHPTLSMLPQALALRHPHFPRAVVVRLVAAPQPLLARRGQKQSARSGVSMAGPNDVPSECALCAACHVPRSEPRNHRTSLTPLVWCVCCCQVRGPR